MPAPSWFQKLRRRKKKAKQQQSPCRGQGGGSPAAGAARNSVSSASNCPGRQCQKPPVAVALSPWEQPAACAAASPNRASYYVPSADRARQDGALLRRVVSRRGDDDDAAEALDVRVDVVHRRAGERRRRRLGGIDAPPGTPELKLRRIVARHDASDVDSSATTSAATTPSTRARGFHVRSPRRRRRQQPDHDGGARTLKDQKAAEAAAEAASPSVRGGLRRRRWLYESLVVVKASSEPERELAESMAEMVAANGIRSSEDLEELLACYLALNAAEHHRAVVAAFRRVWFHLARHTLHHADRRLA